MDLCKLTYFDVRALGEPIRMLLVFAKIPFEDVRVNSSGAEWPALKTKVPMGQLPLLEIDGLRLHQSRAICRYIANKCNLEGKDPIESVHIDMAADVIYDFRITLRGIMKHIDDPILAQKKYEEFKCSFIPLYLSTLDTMVEKNGGYLACGRLSWVDFYFVGGNEYWSHLVRYNILEDYKNLKNLVDKVLALPDLKTYLKSRPETDY